jgi:hypothetical protein
MRQHHARSMRRQDTVIAARGWGRGSNVKRLDQIVLIGSFIGFSWLAMQAAHELGHVLGAKAGGGTVIKVVLHPCTISRRGEKRRSALFIPHSALHTPHSKAPFCLAARRKPIYPRAKLSH